MDFLPILIQVLGGQKVLLFFHIKVAETSTYTDPTLKREDFREAETR